MKDDHNCSKPETCALPDYSVGVQELKPNSWRAEGDE